jgi:hypothetical protein
VLTDSSDMKMGYIQTTDFRNAHQMEKMKEKKKKKD